MPIIDLPQSSPRKRPVLRRFSRTASGERCPPNLSIFDVHPHSTRELPQHSKFVLSAPLTPPYLLKPCFIQKIQATSYQPGIARHTRPGQPTTRPPIPCIDTHYCRSHIPQRVLPTALFTCPFPDAPLIRPWKVFLSSSQVFSLYLGSVPQCISDNWFIFSEGPDQAGKLKIHFHRSWTGMKIAELFVVMDVKGEGVGKLLGIKWNASTDTNRMTEKEVKYMIMTTCQWTLGVKMEEDR